MIQVVYQSVVDPSLIHVVMIHMIIICFVFHNLYDAAAADAVVVGAGIVILTSFLYKDINIDDGDE